MGSPRAGSNLRAHRRRITSREIRSRALELFTVKGFSAVTIEDITAAAHVSQRTFFRYFSTKEDVLLDSQFWIEAMCAQLDEEPQDIHPYVALCEALLVMVERVGEDLQGVRYLRQILGENPHLVARGTSYMLAAMDPVVERVAARMGVSADVDPGPLLLVGVTFATAMASLRVWLSASPRTNLSTVTKRTLDRMDEYSREHSLASFRPTDDVKRNRIQQ